MRRELRGTTVADLETWERGQQLTSTDCARMSDKDLGAILCTPSFWANNFFQIW